VKNLVRMVAVATVASLLLVSVASAHVNVSTTSLRLRVSDSTVQRGDRVTFNGRLSSDWAKCYQFRPVKLQKNGTTIASKKTDANGKVRWTRLIRGTANWNLKFSGRRWGKHPHRHVCKASTSKVIQVQAT